VSISVCTRDSVLFPQAESKVMANAINVAEVVFIVFDSVMLFFMINV
jgi:hypothetical protein